MSRYCWLLSVVALGMCIFSCSEEPTAPSPTPSPQAEVATIQLPITGMTCASCENFIEQTLLREQGIKTVSASHEKRHAEVTYDAAVINPAQMVDAINTTQYRAYMPGTEPPASFPATAPREMDH